MHLGRTKLLEDAPALCLLEDGTADGCWDDNVYGTYLHGFFDEEACCWALLTSLHAMKYPLHDRGLDPTGMHELLLDKLADHMRDNLDFTLICQIIESRSR